jgi:hypothetical protein
MAGGQTNIGSARIMAHPDVSYRIAAVDEEMGIVLMYLDFGDTNSYGPGNALTTFEAFKVMVGSSTQSKRSSRSCPQTRRRAGPTMR